MISLLWTTTDYPLSRLIRWIFGEDVSHFAVLMDNRVVFHSSLMGMGLVWYPHFIRDHWIITRLDLCLSLEEQEAIYLRITDRFAMGGSYDYRAFFYFGFRGIMYRLFNWPLPNRNPWGSQRAWLCTEIAECLEGHVRVPENLDVVSAGMLRKVVLGGDIPKP